MNDVKKDIFHGLLYLPAPFLYIPAQSGERSRRDMKDRVYEVVLSSGKKEEVVMEAAVKERIAATCADALRKRMELYMDKLKEFIPSDGYRRCGKLLVKETFEGEETLTDLLTEYIERTASLRY